VWVLPLEVAVKHPVNAPGSGDIVTLEGGNNLLSPISTFFSSQRQQSVA
jgi:hypothetical protein